MSGALRTVAAVAENVALPIATYLLLRAAGVGDVWALTGSAATAAGVLLAQWLRNHEISALGSVVLVRFALSVALAFLTDDARLLLVKDSAITATIAVLALASLALRRSFVERVRHDLAADPAALEQRLDADAAFRGRHRRMTLAWGAGLLTEAAAATTIALTLPVPAAVVVTNVTGPIVIVALVAATERATRAPSTSRHPDRSAGRSPRPRGHLSEQPSGSVSTRTEDRA